MCLDERNTMAFELLSLYFFFYSISSRFTKKYSAIGFHWTELSAQPLTWGHDIGNILASNYSIWPILLLNMSLRLSLSPRCAIAYIQLCSKNEQNVDSSSFWINLRPLNIVQFILVVIANKIDSAVQKQTPPKFENLAKNEQPHFPLSP